MVYFKVLLNDKRPKADNIYPIEVRVTFNRKNTSFSTGHRISKDFWDDGLQKVKHTNPNSQSLNKFIAEQYSNIQKVALELVHQNNFTFEELKLRLKGKSSAAKPIVQSSFVDFSNGLIKAMIEAKETGNAIIYQTATNRLMAFANNPRLRFVDITYTFLEGFRRQLVQQELKPNSISNYFRTLRAIYNKAIKAKAVDKSHYPFLDIQVKTERTAKRAISVDDLLKIARCELKPKSRHWHARNYFLLSFALTGASFTDLAYLAPANIKKGRLVYKRRKTGKELSIKLHPFTEKLLAQYEGMNVKYLLPVLPSGVVEDSMLAKRAIAQWIKTTNKWLSRIACDCNIEDEITTYVARHTWATTAKRLGYSIELIAEAMGHEHGNKITNIYLDSFDQELIDEMCRKVIERLQ
jgi:integrase/recombinase XerD